jgi:recombination protein RecA
MHARKEVSTFPEYDGDTSSVVSTGSTLLDLAISGERIHGGGIPTGILVEIFGPAGCGKTVLLCEIAGAIQRAGGKVMFHDPEARLNKQFAKMFDLDTRQIAYSTPDTVPEVFEAVRNWETESNLNGIFADSLAALSTNLEMEDGDKMGMRRAKEFSEELRKTCRIIANKKYLMVCSNQVRINTDAGPWGQKYTTPGGEAIGFYSSLRLRAQKPQKIKDAKVIAGKKISRVIGVETEFEVFKSTVGKPYRTAPVVIVFDYGIDDIRANLQFIKDHTSNTTYQIGKEKLDNSMKKAIEIVEEKDLVDALKKEVITLWTEIEGQFASERLPKRR